VNERARRSLRYLPIGGTGGFGGNGSGGGVGVGGAGFGGDGVSGIGILLETRLYCSHLP
jgi:hypothetical protein